MLEKISMVIFLFLCWFIGAFMISSSYVHFKMLYQDKVNDKIMTIEQEDKEINMIASHFSLGVCIIVFSFKGLFL